MDDSALTVISTGLLQREHLLDISEVLIANNGHITDESIELLFGALALRFPKTQTIDLSGCHATPATVDVVIEYTVQYCDISEPLTLPKIVWHNTLIGPFDDQRFIATLNAIHSQIMAEKNNAIHQSL